jgi:hypothetical protein
MRKRVLAAAWLAVPIILLSGCNSQETKTVSRETAAMAIKYNELCKAGKTTPAQDKAYIAAIAGVAFQLDRAIRGTTNATTTQKQATLEAQTGIDVTAPLDLNVLQQKLEKKNSE